MTNANLHAGLLATFITLSPLCGAFAQAGSLDPDFGEEGIVTTGMNGTAHAVAIQPDGRIVAAGYSSNGFADFALVRYHADGALDPSFSADGKVTTDIEGRDYAKSVAVQSDGRIVVAGMTSVNLIGDFAVVRYLADGSLDTTFGVNGIVTTAIGAGDDRAEALVIQPDGKIVVAGHSNGGPENNFAVVRYHADGSLDPSFGGDGMVTTAFGAGSAGAAAVAVQPDGRILVAGRSGFGTATDFTTVRYNTDGTLDTGFGTDGVVITAFSAQNDGAFSLTIQPDGKILAAGNVTDSDGIMDFALARYDTVGSLDPGFGFEGKLVTVAGESLSMAYSVAVEVDGKILAAGLSFDADGLIGSIALVRYQADGTPDNGFGADGIVTTSMGGYHDEALAVAIQPDGKIVAAGGSDELNFAVVRYISGSNIGVIEFSDPGASALFYPNPMGNDATLRYALGDEERISIELRDHQGSLVHTFIDNQVQGPGEHQQSIALPQLPSGSYFLVISSAHGRMSIRCVK